MESQTIEVAALGRPLYPGMLYDCRKHTFIPGVTLWDKKSLATDLDSREQQQTDLKLSSSESLSAKSSLMDISASLKASFMGGLVEVSGSAKYLHDTKSSNQQSRVTMFYSETTKFEQLTMNQLGKCTYPQVFDQKNATHVVIATLYGAQAFMVFDRMISDDENKQEIEGQLSVMVKKIPGFSIEGEGAAKIGDADQKKAEKISCTFHGDFHLEQNPITYMEALKVYKELPKCLKESKDNGIPLKVWLYPLHLLNRHAAQLVKEVGTHLVSDTEAVLGELGEVEKRFNDLFNNTLVNVFSDIKERLSSFMNSFRTYKLIFQRAMCTAITAIKGGQQDEQSLGNILKNHSACLFDASKLNQWLDDQQFEIDLLTYCTKSLGSEDHISKCTIKTLNGLNLILLDPKIDKVMCLAFTSLKYEDHFLSSLNGFLESGKPDQGQVLNSSEPKWFRHKDVIIRMRKTLSDFTKCLDENNENIKTCFIISAINDPVNEVASIYEYKQGKLIDQNYDPCKCSSEQSDQ